MPAAPSEDADALAYRRIKQSRGSTKVQRTARDLRREWKRVKEERRLLIQDQRALDAALKSEWCEAEEDVDDAASDPLASLDDDIDAAVKEVDAAAGGDVSKGDGDADSVDELVAKAEAAAKETDALIKSAEKAEAEAAAAAEAEAGAGADAAGAGAAAAAGGGEPKASFGTGAGAGAAVTTIAPPAAKPKRKIGGRRFRLNVGGQIFEVTEAVLSKEPRSVLAAITHADPPVAADDKGVFFFDRDWWLFRHILRYERDGADALPTDRHLLREM